MTSPANREIYVAFTMDCLPAGATAEVLGPEDWTDAAAAPVAFAGVLAEMGLGGTFFIAPEAVERCRSAVDELRSAGCELGMLCHPQLSGYRACLGSYRYELQREIIGLDRKAWEAGAGERPLTFRPGFFSANDHTYHALCMEGFRQGSCSLPGRMDGDQCSMWFGCYPFPHHTDPLDRCIEGTVEFFEFPVTSDFEAASHPSYETYTPPHLRIEEMELHAYARGLVQAQLDRMAEEGLPLMVITFVTSNHVGWHRQDDPHPERLRNLCQMLREVAGARGMELRWKSLDDIHSLWDEQYQAQRALKGAG